MKPNTNPQKTSTSISNTFDSFFITIEVSTTFTFY